MRFKKILAIRIDRLGDMILTLPAIKTLKDNFPESEISILCRPFLKDFLLTQPYIDKVFCYNVKTSFLNKIMVFKSLRKEKFDLAIDFVYAKNITSAFFSFLSGAKKCLGFNTGIRSFFHTIKVPGTKNLKYEAERNLDLIRPLKLNITKSNFSLSINKKTINSLKQKFPFLKTKKRLICIHPGVNNHDKRRMWDSKKFARLARKLMQNYNAEIFITGTGNEKKLVQDIISQSKIHCHNLAGKTNLQELCALISLTDLVICTLTGVTHISVLLNKPTITLCGPTPHKRWTNEKYTVIKKDLPCSPCEHLAECFKNNYECMKKIEVKAIIKQTKLHIK